MYCTLVNANGRIESGYMKAPWTAVAEDLAQKLYRIKPNL